MWSVSYVTYVDIISQVSLTRSSIFLFFDLPTLKPSMVKLRIIINILLTDRPDIILPTAHTTKSCLRLRRNEYEQALYQMKIVFKYMQKDHPTKTLLILISQKAYIQKIKNYKKLIFPLGISSVNVTKSAVSKEILNGKLHFFCAVTSMECKHQKAVAYMCVYLSNSEVKCSQAMIYAV